MEGEGEREGRGGRGRGGKEVRGRAKGGVAMDIFHLYNTVTLTQELWEQPETNKFYSVSYECFVRQKQTNINLKKEPSKTFNPVKENVFLWRRL